MKDGSTTLQLVISLNLRYVIGLLVYFGADLENIDDMGSTALILRAMSNADVRRLIDSGSNVNVMDRFGFTAMHYAVETNDIANIRHMLRQITMSISVIDTAETSLHITRH